jgi:hypothetical protein
MLHHAKLWALGQKYGLARLQEFALQKIRQSDAWDSPQSLLSATRDITQTLDYMYSNTVAEGMSSTGAASIGCTNRLRREFSAQFAKNEAFCLVDEPEFEKLAEKNHDFVLDLAYALQESLVECRTERNRLQSRSRERPLI